MSASIRVGTVVWFQTDTVGDSVHFQGEIIFGKKDLPGQCTQLMCEFSKYERMPCSYGRISASQQQLVSETYLYARLPLHLLPWLHLPSFDAPPLRYRCCVR